MPSYLNLSIYCCQSSLAMHKLLFCDYNRYHCNLQHGYHRQSRV